MNDTLLKLEKALKDLETNRLSLSNVSNRDYIETLKIIRDAFLSQFIDYEALRNKVKHEMGWKDVGDYIKDYSDDEFMNELTRRLEVGKIFVFADEDANKIFGLRWETKEGNVSKHGTPNQKLIDLHLQWFLRKYKEQRENQITFRLGGIYAWAEYELVDGKKQLKETYFDWKERLRAELAINKDKDWIKLEWKNPETGSWNKFYREVSLRLDGKSIDRFIIDFNSEFKR